VQTATRGDLNPPPSVLPDFTPKLLITSRIQSGLTRRQLADQLSVSARTILNWETSRTRPSVQLWTLTKRVLSTATERFEPPGDSAAV
jgi:DNA-binding XRE family transcriptional regulator